MVIESISYPRGREVIVSLEEIPSTIGNLADLFESYPHVEVLEVSRNELFPDQAVVRMSRRVGYKEWHIEQLVYDGQWINEYER